MRRRFLARLVDGGVGGVALLPQELGGAQEQPRAHFPADDIGPLVDEQRQVAVRLHPFREHGADDGFGGRPDDERLFEFAGGHERAVGPGFEPVVGDHRALLGESLHMLRLLFEEALRDEEREIGVLVAGVLEHFVEDPLDVLPQPVAPRLDHHAAAHRRILGQVGRLDHLLVPFGIVVGPGRGNCRFLLCHVNLPLISVSMRLLAVYPFQFSRIGTR